MPSYEQEQDSTAILLRKSLPIKNNKIKPIIEELLSKNDTFSLGILIGKLYRRYKREAKEKIYELLDTKYIDISKQKDFYVGLASILPPRALTDYGLKDELEAIRKIFLEDPWLALQILKISVANFYGYLQWLGKTIDSYLELLVDKGIQSCKALEFLLDTLHSASIEKFLRILINKWDKLSHKEQAYAFAAILNKVYSIGVEPEYPKINEYLKPRKQNDFDRKTANLLAELAEKISPEETVDYLAEALELAGLKTLIGLSQNYPEFQKLLENLAKAIQTKPEAIGNKNPMLLALQTRLGLPLTKIINILERIRPSLESLAKFLVVLSATIPDEEFLEFVAKSEHLGDIFTKSLSLASPPQLIMFFKIAEPISNAIIENSIILGSLRKYLKENFLAMIKLISSDVPILQALARQILLENNELLKSRQLTLHILEYLDMPIDKIMELLIDHKLFLKHIVYNPLIPLPIPGILESKLENIDINEAYNILYNLVIRTHHDVARKIVPPIINTLLNKKIKLKDASRLACLITDQRLIDEDSKIFENMITIMRNSLIMAEPKQILRVLDIIAKRIDNYVRCLRDFSEHREYTMLEQILHKIHARFGRPIGYNKMAKIILRALSEKRILDELSKLRVTQLLKLYGDISRIRIVLQAKNELDSQTYEAYKKIISDPKINEKIYAYLQQTLRKRDKNIINKVLKLNKKYHEIPIFRAVIREFLKKTNARMIVRIVERALREKRTIYDYAQLYTILRIALEELREKNITGVYLEYVRKVIDSAKLPTNMKNELLKILR